MMVLQVFITFVTIGALTVGGGLATIPYLIELGNNSGWFSEQFLMTMIAISESTPGPIGINMATVVGVRVAGILGGVAASIGVSLVGVLVMIVIAPSVNEYRSNKYVIRILKGLRPTMIGLILSAAFILWRNTIMSLLFQPILMIYGVIIAIACVILSLRYQLKSYQIIVFCALCGWGLSFIL